MAGTRAKGVIVVTDAGRTVSRSASQEPLPPTAERPPHRRGWPRSPSTRPAGRTTQCRPGRIGRLGNPSARAVCCQAVARTGHRQVPLVSARRAEPSRRSGSTARRSVRRRLRNSCAAQPYRAHLSGRPQAEPSTTSRTQCPVKRRPLSTNSVAHGPQDVTEPDQVVDQPKLPATPEIRETLRQLPNRESSCSPTARLPGRVEVVPRWTSIRPRQWAFSGVRSSPSERP